MLRCFICMFLFVDVFTVELTVVLSLQHVLYQPCFALTAFIPYEPAHEITAHFVLRKLILQTRMRSHPVGLDV